MWTRSPRGPKGVVLFSQPQLTTGWRWIPPQSLKALAGGREDRADSEEAKGDESPGRYCSLACGGGRKESDPLLLVSAFASVCDLGGVVVQLFLIQFL